MAVLLVAQSSAVAQYLTWAVASRADVGSSEIGTDASRYQRRPEPDETGSLHGCLGHR
jgi:hypothetical protein